jgi:transposase
MTCFVGLDVSQKMTAICVVDSAGHRLWRGQCPSNPEQINILVRRHAGDDARIGIETGAMTPWLVHELRTLGLEAICLESTAARMSRRFRGGRCVPVSHVARPGSAQSVRESLRN